MTVELDHDTQQRIHTAGRWLAEHLDTAPQPHTKLLRESFGLPFPLAVKAMALAKRIKLQEGRHG